MQCVTVEYHRQLLVRRCTGTCQVRPHGLVAMLGYICDFNKVMRFVHYNHRTQVHWRSVAHCTQHNGRQTVVRIYHTNNQSASKCITTGQLIITCNTSPPGRRPRHSILPMVSIDVIIACPPYTTVNHRQSRVSNCCCSHLECSAAPCHI